MIDFSKQTKQGYKILSIVDTGSIIREGKPYLLAIAKRETKYQPYVLCTGYDTEDGTWGSGYYFNSFKNASTEMCNQLLSWLNRNEENEED